ncbi:recombinase family protein [Carnobacteriaceae bacterium zg-84]|uniref:recombinase family protein n=1 Tax=Granulicatella sp. zg-84 TaxID=2678503 RepID=UPI0013C2714B|nr:recombinase family protein [Granulicatella sp. zg-84]NEW66026.1 recombinase family protein [Granulicatella sp. zg-84]QMI86559.1 recombinase family protein [Carnobacteriaceae bacterium zg-84]
MTKKIITIEADKRLSNQSKLPSVHKRKVAGYARVSTDLEDQASSYETQMNYYESYINSRSDWEFVKMYSDEGISGTTTKKRLGFQEMVSDAMDGKIDLIITKSVSRFARNTVDSLSTVRQLKDKGVEIYFEKENIWTFDSKGELLITIMSSIAQEESRSISENVKWAKRKNAAEGKVTFSYSTVLGFKQSEDGGFEVDKDEARIVEYIFSLFLKGKNPNQIARELTEKNIKTPAGKEKWSYGSVKSILQNEKYKGDALLQKYYSVDFLNKQQKKNEGELPQYYVENSHEAIIDKEIFDMVQVQLRHNTKWATEKNYFSKIECGCCGNKYCRYIWHSNSKYKRHIYRCSHKYKDKNKCQTPHVTDEDIQEWIVDALNQQIANKEEIIDNLGILVHQLESNMTLKDEINTLNNKLTVVQDEVENLVYTNSKLAQDQSNYQKIYDKLVKTYEKLELLLEEKKEELVNYHIRIQNLKSCIDIIGKQDTLIREFNPTLFNILIEKIVIETDKRITIHFTDGKILYR